MTDRAFGRMIYGECNRAVVRYSVLSALRAGDPPGEAVQGMVDWIRGQATKSGAELAFLAAYDRAVAQLTLQQLVDA